MQIELPPAELYARAELIADVEPTSAETRWVAGSDGSLETEVWLSVVELVKGRADGPLSLVLAGGSRDGYRVAVEDVPLLTLDAPVRLFLITGPNGWEILGGEQGVVRLGGPPPVAFSTEGFDWTWQPAPAEEPFELNTTTFSPIAEADDIEAIYLTALSKWNFEAASDLYVEYGGRTSVRQQGNGDDDHNADIYGGTVGGSTLAISTTTFIGDDMIDCDTDYFATNGYGHITWHIGADTAPRNQFDIQNTITHELGHCLGLGHSNDDRAVMYAYNSDATGEDARHLAADDINGIQRIYGAVAPELSIAAIAIDDADGGDGDGIAEAGESFELVLDVENSGDGTAWGVTVDLSGEPALGSRDPVELGHVGAPTAVGERIADSVIQARFPLAVDAGCTEDFTAELTASLADLPGSAWDEPVGFDVVCAAPADTDADRPGESDGGREHPGHGGGCGCAHGGRSGAALAAILALVARRRREPAGGHR